MTFTPNFSPAEAFALAMDAADPLRRFRDCFHLPEQGSGEPWIYLCGHSLGLQPKSVRPALLAQLAVWASLGVEGHFHGPAPWYTFEETLRQPGGTARRLPARRGRLHERPDRQPAPDAGHFLQAHR